jgi:hypothetical protein
VNRLWLATLLSLAACGALNPPTVDAGTDAGQSGGMDASAEFDAGTFTGTIEVTRLYTDRSRLGARSIAGFRPWRGGLAVLGDWLYWAESGSAPGLYRAPAAGCAGASCVEKVATMVRPSAFAATADSVLVSDVATLKRYFADGGTQPLGTASTEVVNLTTDGTAAFWTTESNPVVKTPFGSASTTLINSNGTPVAMSVAGSRVYWAGVDISGSLGALQSIGTNGAGAREESRFANGFETLGGNGTYLYYAKDSPAQVVRLTLSSGMLEVAATNCQGVRDFAIDATHAYWVEPGSAPDYANGRVRRVAHESTTPETLAQAVPHPQGIALQGAVLFVASAGSPATSYADGAILRITLPP